MTTDTSDPAETPTARQPVDTTPRKNFFQRIAGALFAPAETFGDIARKPDILAPLFVLLAIGYISTFVIAPIVDWDAVQTAQIEQMRKNPNVSEQDAERFARMGVRTGKFMVWVSPFLGAIWWVIVAGVLLLAVRLFGGEGNFKQAFSATLYAWIPLTIFSIVLLIVARARGSFDPQDAATLVKSNPAFLIDMKEQPVLFSLVSSFDVFTIWTIVLLIFGFAALSRLSKGKSAAIVISLWIVMIVVKVGLAALGAGMSKG